jgi:hypothetical protein
MLDMNRDRLHYQQVCFLMVGALQRVMSHSVVINQ